MDNKPLKNLTFETTIRAPRKVVWETMLGPDTYNEWTAAFCEGSYFEGSWEQGEKIRFMSPTGDGMSSVIAENRLHEFVSIRHLGTIENGVEDTTSDKVRAWTPAYENYRFSDLPDGCRVLVTVDTVAEYEQYMRDTFPKALAVLKTLSEERAA